MDGPGVAVISGTGSICFGKNAEGRTARSGGFGHIIDDGGSGYALGRDVLSGAVRCIDGRAKDSGILRAVCDRLEGGPEKIVPFVYSPGTDKSAIAKFSHIALSLAERGDPEAATILARGAEELYALVAAVQENLGLPQCPIALLGGLIAEDNAYRRIVAEKLGALGTVIAPAHNALWGAAQMAFEL
jgi:N-acetylglucosamine kinase-like BadF-type ATPase